MRVTYRNIAVERARKRMSIEKLAEASGVSRSTIWAAEAQNKSIKFENLAKIASALNVPVEALYIIEEVS